MQESEFSYEAGPERSNPFGEAAINIRGTGAPWQITSEWRAIGGRAEPVSIKIERTDGKPITATAVRSLPLGDILAASRKTAIAESAVEMKARADSLEANRAALLSPPFLASRPDGSDADARVLIDHIYNDEIAKVTAAFSPFQQVGPQRGRVLSMDELQRVADVYRDAFGKGESVQRAVAKDRHVSPSTATKRIMAARKAGLLDGIGHTR